MRRGGTFGLALALTLALALLAAASGQHSNSQPAFDVAVLREWPPGRSPRRYRTDVFRQDPGRIIGQYSPLTALLRYAFNLSPSAPIEGLPGWAGPPGGSFLAASKFSLDARMPASTSDAETRIMIQSLLRDRFRLVWHWTSKSTRVLDLTVAPGGVRVKPSDPNSDPKVPDGTRLTCPPDVSGCAFMGMQALTMAELAGALPISIFGRPVVDKTGLQGKFYFPEMIFVPPNETSSSVASAPTTLRQATGLALRPAMANLPVLVVDQVAKPRTDPGGTL